METKVRYLIDANIWLERLLDQEKSEVVSRLFERIPMEDLFVRDFSIHSIGVILSKYKRLKILQSFLEDLFINAQIEQLSLNTKDLLNVISNIQKFNLDFDDAYQLSVSQKYDLILVTFDKDFDVKGIRKNTPEEIILKEGTTDRDSLA